MNELATSWVSTVQNASDDVMTQMAPKITAPLNTVSGMSATFTGVHEMSTRPSTMTMTMTGWTSRPTRRGANSEAQSCSERAGRTKEEQIEGARLDVARRQLDLAHEEIGQAESGTRESEEQCDLGAGPSPDAVDL